MHSDLAGGGKIKRTKGGHKWLASMVDDATNMVFTFGLKKKSDLPKILYEFLDWMSTQGHPVQRLSSDNESIYAGYKVQDLLKERGIQ